MMSIKGMITIAILILDTIIFLWLISWIGFYNFKTFVICFMLTYAVVSFIQMYFFERLRLPNDIIIRENNIYLPLAYMLALIISSMLAARFVPVWAGVCMGFFLSLIMLHLMMPELSRLKMGIDMMITGLLKR